MNQTYLARTTQSSFLLSPYPFHPWTNVETVSLPAKEPVFAKPNSRHTKANGAGAPGSAFGPYS